MSIGSGPAAPWRCALLVPALLSLALFVKRGDAAGRAGARRWCCWWWRPWTWRA